MIFPKARFTGGDVSDAYEEWGLNCGPGSLAAVLGLAIAEVRPHMGDFEEKHYTNPTLMWAALRSLGVDFTVKRQRDFPSYGLARIQWEGPWTAPGVPARVAYRHSHWVGAAGLGDRAMIFDINAMQVGGWIGAKVWSKRLVPWLLENCEPKATGGWFVTHAVSIPAPLAKEAAT